MKNSSHEDEYPAMQSNAHSPKYYADNNCLCICQIENVDENDQILSNLISMWMNKCRNHEDKILLANMPGSLDT
jgi:hypothetical protein